MSTAATDQLTTVSTGGLLIFCWCCTVIVNCKSTGSCAIGTSASVLLMIYWGSIAEATGTPL